MIQFVEEKTKLFIDIMVLLNQYLPKYRTVSGERIIRELKAHQEHNTLDYLYEGDKLIALVRYNILNNGRVADILDFIVVPGQDGKKIIRYFIAHGWIKFPSLQFVRFQRALKNKRGYNMYRIERFITGGKKND